MDGIDTLPGKRTVEVYYGQRTILSDVPVSSLSEEVDLHFAAAKKALGVDSDMVPRVTCEAVLTGGGSVSTFQGCTCKGCCGQRQQEQKPFKCSDW